MLHNHYNVTFIVLLLEVYFTHVNYNFSRNCASQ